MSKRSNINWQYKDTSKNLERTVKNFNAKINRIVKKNPIMKEYLPETIKLSEIKGRISTRQDLNREINMLKRFSKPNAMEIIVDKNSGLTLTKWEIKEGKKLGNIVNQKRAKELEQLNLNEKKGTASQIEKNNLKPKNVNTNKSKEEWRKSFKSSLKEAATNFKDKGYQLYKENYLKGIENGLNAKNSQLYNLIKNMDAKTLYERSVNNPFLIIGFHYDPMQDSDDLYDAVLEEWYSLLE